GSLVLTLRPLGRRGLAVCVSNLVGACILVAYGLSETLLLSAGVLLVWGLCASVFINYVVALLQEHADPTMMGRVMSMYSLVFFVAMPIGYAQAGVVTTLWGPQTTLVANGLAAAAVGLGCVLFLRPVRVLE
ncbi:MAG TPA: hypothetical protein VLA62_10425, partial [Solirubrobacterales bacterium]|nr:hypothetical protein [Solirubrobacterales bacterium]